MKLKALSITKVKDRQGKKGQRRTPTGSCVQTVLEMGGCV